MRKFQNLIIGGLIIALGLSLTALILSVKSYSAIRRFETEIENMNLTVERIRPLVDKVDVIMDTFEDIMEMKPRLQHLLLYPPEENE